MLIKQHLWIGAEMIAVTKSVRVGQMLEAVNTCEDVQPPFAQRSVKSLSVCILHVHIQCRAAFDGKLNSHVLSEQLKVICCESFGVQPCESAFRVLQSA